MSITASWLTLAVIAIRFLLKKAPKAFSVILWALVGIRLIFPISYESILSLVPSAETVPRDIIYSYVPGIDSGIEAMDSAVNPFISQSLAPSEATGIAPMQIITSIASAVWIAGVAAMLLYTAMSYLRFRRKVREAAPLDKNVYLCDGIGTPFILGVIRPRIYLPSDIGKADMEYVISHEKAHIRRCDHLWKPLGFLLLTVYWFNPVLWIAYILLCRDIELACDEKVIKDRGSEIKKSYSEALINCSVPRKMIAACPLAFGEGSVKGRIKSVLNYKKPAFWIIIVSVIACIAVAACFLTNPITKVKLPENFTIFETHSTFEDISISVKEVKLDTDDPYIKIEWKNDTNNYLTYSDLFDIEYYDLETGEVNSCKKEDISSFLPLYILEAGKSEVVTYSLQGFDLSKDGVYTFSTYADHKYNNTSGKENLVIVFGIGTEVTDTNSLDEALGYSEVAQTVFEAKSTKLEKASAPDKLPNDITYYNNWDKNTEWIRIGKASDPDAGIYAKNSVVNTLLLRVENEYYTLNWQKARSLEQMIRLHTADIDHDGEEEIVAVFDTPGEPHWNKKELHVIDRVGNELFDIEFPLEKFAEWILENCETKENGIRTFETIMNSEIINTDTRLENVISFGIFTVRNNRIIVSVSINDVSYLSPLGEVKAECIYQDGEFAVVQRTVVGYGRGGGYVYDESTDHN